MWRAILAFALSTIAMPAQAAWMAATSRHFIVYADASEVEVRKLATDLENFNAVVHFFHSLPDPPESASNRVTVYVVPSIAAVQRLCGRCSGVAGFYEGRASGSIAFTPRRGEGGGVGDLKPRIVLFHEYAHHFLLGNSQVVYPAWYSEGYAEFVSTMQSDATGFLIGAPANHRAYGLFNIDFPIARLFAPPPVGRALRPEEMEAIYGRGWLLVHYMLFTPARSGQLDHYLRLFNAGKSSLEAATTAFGDLKTLDRDLQKYMRSSSLTGARIPPDKIATPVVTIRPFTAGERAMIDLRMVSDRGVSDDQARALYARAAPIAARFPEDAAAQGWFAEIAYDAGEDAAALAAADRALAVQPGDTQALSYKASVEIRRLTGKSADLAAWKAARALIIKANRQDPDNAWPLMLFYGSFTLEGIPPTKSAIAGLYRAQELVPQDEGLRWVAAQQRIEDNDLDGAKKLLRPLAYSPHAGPDNSAAKLLAMLDAGKSRDEIHAVLAAATEKAKEAGAKNTE